MKKKYLYWSGFILFSIAVIGAYVWYQYNRKAGDILSLSTAKRLSSAELLDAFTRNEKQADNLYTGAVLELSGHIRAVEKDTSGSVTVVLGDTTSLSSVRCLLLAETKSTDVTLLQPGTAVAIKGICTGFRPDDMGLGADVLMNRCIIKK
jgi:hypothetical protein